MALVEPSAFSPAAVIATTRRRSQGGVAVGPSSRSPSGEATASRPSARSPRAISTKPPKIERAAEPEPRRASSDSSLGGSSSPAARDAASASAAKPDADDASPDAVGTLFSVATSARAAMPGARAHAIEESDRRGRESARRPARRRA